MSELVVPAVVLGVLALVVLALLVAILVRRNVLSRGVGAFACSLRYRPSGGGWAFGVARYEHDRLDWFRLFDFSLRPKRSLSRARLTILEYRKPDGQDTAVLDPSWVLVRCIYDATMLELGMSEMAYTGLATWLESAPPGQHPVIS
jgi:hypothetical protein